MRIGKRITQGREPGSKLESVETFRSFLHTRVGESRAVDVFHADRRSPFILDEVKNADDIWVGQQEALAGLPFQVFAGGWIKTNRLWHQFECHKPLEAIIACQPDDAHSTTPENFLDRKALEKLRPPNHTAHRLPNILLFLLGSSRVHAEAGKSRGRASRVSSGTHWAIPIRHG